MKYFDVNDLPQMLFAEKELIHWAVDYTDRLKTDHMETENELA